MSEYGIKIKNYQAGSIFEVLTGVRDNYDSKPAMLTNSLFLDFLLANGLDVYKESSTRDVICIEFNYGSRSFEKEVKHLKELGRKNREEYRKERAEGKKGKAYLKKKRFSELYLKAVSQPERFIAKNKNDIRDIFYRDGVVIRYPVYGRKGVIKNWDEVKYRMLYRTTGKAKKGSCMFICERLYEKAKNFLWMGIELPEQNAPVVEIGAYSSLITSTIVDRIRIDPDEILVLPDVDSSIVTDVVSVETDENRSCRAVRKKNYPVTNTLFDGQSLIDESIFPDWGNGYLLLRQHFTKSAAFKSRIQQFFKDYYGDDYETAEVTDLFGRKVRVKNIKLITTDNSLKWLKFKGITYEYWANWVRAGDSLWGVVKTAHPSKLGDVQRMSYQMVNALSPESLDSVLSCSKDYVGSLKRDNEEFLRYLEKNKNFSNDFEVLIALVKQNPLFARSTYFRRRKVKILESYVLNLKNGRLIQNADNLTIVGSPYAMLLHAVGEDPLSDPTFYTEDVATCCYTERFNEGEYLAEFRSPFNSRNNLGYLKNTRHPLLEKYFDLGTLCIAVNMIETTFQCRNNGLTIWAS